MRAHNLVWALWELQKSGGRRLDRVAVVGGGVSGLTAVACFLSLFKDTISVSLFEQHWDLCPLQQGSDGRWLHPRIYDWPEEGSRAPSASLPVLNWSEGRASDVARTVIRGFSEYCDEFARSEEHLSIYLGLRYFHINSGTREIGWVGHKANRTGAFFHLGRPVGCAAFFDTIVLAAGFGLETQMPGYSIESYWRNEQLAQPTLDGGQRRYLVSGFGDGALVDLCRLTIERFRQDTIVYELFEPDLSKVEKELRKRDRKNNVFNLFKAIEDELLSHAKTQLADRIRKDTRVTLHMRGRHNEITAFPQIFGSNSSFLNQLLTYLLYRCGAFAPDFSELAEAVKRYNVPDTNVLCRYGANTIEHLSALFVDSSRLAKRFAKMKQDQKQKPYRRWVPGIFPHLPTT